MAKRLSDTEIWKDQWYRELTPEYKCFWKYVCDNCDLCGVWNKDVGLASYQIGSTIDEKKALELFNKDKERILVINEESKWFILGFTNFQYGELKKKKKISPIHKKVLEMLMRYRVLDRVSVGYQYPVRKRKGRGISKEIKIIFDKEVRQFLGITDETKKLWGEAYPACNIDLELKRMVAWIIANPKKGKKSNYERFITNWLNSNQDKGGTKGVTNGSTKGSASEYSLGEEVK